MEFDIKLLHSSLLKFRPIYYKMLLVNLSSDTYQPIIIPDSEYDLIKPLTYKITSYLSWFAHSYLIHDDDRHKFIQLSQNLSCSDNFLCYRRLIDSEWHWVLLRIFPNQDNPAECLLTVQDIHKEYDRVVDIIGTTDTMTGLYNKLAFERDSVSCPADGFVGVVFGDLNGLKYTNDNFGHQEGDRLIKRFAKLLRDNFKSYRCYHISGDEFVVAGFDIKIHEFLSCVLSFHKGLWDNDTPPIAALGYSAGVPQDILAITECAEKAMYEDKQKFYDKFPQMRR